MTTNDATTGTPPMIGRRLSSAEWLAYVANYQFGTIAPTRVVLHHTWIPTVAQWSGLQSMRAIQRYYAEKGWQAAPHIFVGPDGIWLFTPMKDVGVHAGTGNSGISGGRFWYSIGVEVVGDYDRTLPSGQVWEHTKAVLGGLSRRLNIPIAQLLSFHRDYTNQKSCPGWAITKSWVIGEVEAWLQQRPPPPTPPPGPILNPTPEQAALAEMLLEESYRRRGEGYNSDWAFHQYAVQNNLGMPIGRSKQISFEGKQYAYQPFARDTLYNEVPNWGDVRSLKALLNNRIPTSGLGRVLLEASYQAGGSALRPDWAFHQYAVQNNLGPPLGPSTTLTVDNAQYAYQVFATDTLYNLVPNWSDVRRLSALAQATDAAQVRLRSALLAQTYRAGGATYHADWAFHQQALNWNLGTPLSESYRVSSGAAQYSIQVYATDTLYNLVPNWSDVRRLSMLTRPSTAPRAVEAPPSSLPRTEPRATDEPTTFQIVQYSAATARPIAYSERSGSRISLIVLHSDIGPAAQTLAAMAALGAQSSTHYYIASDATIYQLIDDRYAAWHSGMATWRGRTQNINRISLGIVLEQTADGYTQRQLDALTWLVEHLQAQYNVPREAVVRWSDLNPRANTDPANFPWNSWQQRLNT